MNLNQILRSAWVQQPFIYKVILQSKWKHLGLFVSEARAFATADMPLGNWKKNHVKGDDWKNYSTEQVEKEKTFVIYLRFTNVSSKLEKRKKGSFSLPSDNIVRIKFIWIIYLYSEKGIPHGNFSAVSTEL